MKSSLLLEKEAQFCEFFAASEHVWHAVWFAVDLDPCPPMPSSLMSLISIATFFRGRKPKPSLVNLSQRSNLLMKKAPSSPEK